MSHTANKKIAEHILMLVKIINWEWWMDKKAQVWRRDQNCSGPDSDPGRCFHFCE